MTVFIIITPEKAGDDGPNAHAQRARARITDPTTACQPRKEG